MTDEHRDRDIRNEDSRPYWRFTGPQRLDKALHTLEGLLQGVAADRQITKEEIAAIRQWLDDHWQHASRHPFDEIIPFLDDVLADGVVDEEEARDILWLCDRLSTSNAYFAAVTSDLQRLQGMLGGVALDGKIDVEELRQVRDWMDQHEHLKGCWPFDEIGSLLVHVLQDQQINPTEHRVLLAFCSQFVEMGDHRAVDLPLNEMVAPIEGFCAVCPEVAFRSKSFCFTGRSERVTRRQLAALVEELGGNYQPSVRADLDYLIIGAAGNAAWAFSCYGRKVEQAMAHRKTGCPIVLVHELDFWDAVADAGR